ncbi:MAG: hypothetical protein V3V20_07445 [Algisphaera sp.]
MNKPTRPSYRSLLPLCALALILFPGCVSSNPFFNLSAALWSAISYLF